VRRPGDPAWIVHWAVGAYRTNEMDDAALCGRQLWSTYAAERRRAVVLRLTQPFIRGLYRLVNAWRSSVVRRTYAGQAPCDSGL
jgi:hypothetical protein